MSVTFPRAARRLANLVLFGLLVSCTGELPNSAIPANQAERYYSLSATTPKGRYDVELVDPFHYEPADALPDARLTALMPGRVVKVMAGVGDAVKKGQGLMILEAMKMEHTITSPREGVIERVAFRENDLVPADAVLFAFREPS